MRYRHKNGIRRVEKKKEKKKGEANKKTYPSVLIRISRRANRPFVRIFVISLHDWFFLIFSIFSATLNWATEFVGSFPSPPYSGRYQHNVAATYFHPNTYARSVCYLFFFFLLLDSRTWAFHERFKHVNTKQRNIII